MSVVFCGVSRSELLVYAELSAILAMDLFVKIEIHGWCSITFYVRGSPTATCNPCENTYFGFCYGYLANGSRAVALALVDNTSCRTP